MTEKDMKYPKINTIWKRDENNRHNIIEGNFSDEEFKIVDRWHITEKIDGTNIRIFWDGENVRYGGRTENAQMPTFLLQHLMDTFTKEKLSSVFGDEPKSVVLFGEGYGNKIQKAGKLYRNDVSFILFDVVIDDVWLNRESVEDIAITKLGIRPVPVIGIMTTQEAVEYVKSRPDSTISEKTQTTEGIVARSEPLLLYRRGSPLMWKLKVKDYDRLNR